MSDKPEYIYIMYPVKIEDATKLPFLPLALRQPDFIPPDEENFVPLWYGNARFPEDDV